MKTVITYGTFDLFHVGHLNLLRRAKELGDYLIVAVSSDEFNLGKNKVCKIKDTDRMKIVEAIKYVDKVIPETSWEQKIEDVKKYNVDVFVMGDDWKGKFDYLNEYCKVIYLERTKGVSSSELRSEKRKLRMTVEGDDFLGTKFRNESRFVNGVEIASADADAYYLVTTPDKHYEQIKKFLLDGKHVLCESPIACSGKECKELFEIAKKQKCVLMEGIKTAYSTAYSRLLLLAKSGEIGKIVSVDATCTSMRDDLDSLENKWNSISAWGPTALLPIFQLLGTNYTDKKIISHYIDDDKMFDGFTKIDFIYPDSVASIKVAKTAKSEGELIITGTKGYIYVPAPWWKTDYFEIRYEDPTENKRYFYKLDGEGIRYEIVAFNRSIESGKNYSYIDSKISIAISEIIEACKSNNVIEI